MSDYVRFSDRSFCRLPVTPTGPSRKTKEAAREQHQRARLRAWSKRSESTRYLPIDQGRATSVEALHMRTDHIHNRCCAGPEAPVAVTEVKADRAPIAGKIRAGGNRLGFQVEKAGWNSPTNTNVAGIDKPSRGAKINRRLTRERIQTKSCG